MKRFLAALVLAPIVGAAAGFLAVMIGSLIAGTEHERTLAGAAFSASFIGFWALLICLAYSIVIGSAAYVYTRVSRRRLSLLVALTVAVLCGAIPWGIAAVAGRDLRGEALMFPGLALLCSVATAWTFWRVAFAEANA
jgi:uncharacterized membrane protein